MPVVDIPSKGSLISNTRQRPMRYEIATQLQQLVTQFRKGSLLLTLSISWLRTAAGNIHIARTVLLILGRSECADSF